MRNKLPTPINIDAIRLKSNTKKKNMLSKQDYLEARLQMQAITTSCGHCGLLFNTKNKARFTCLPLSPDQNFFDKYSSEFCWRDFVNEEPSGEEEADAKENKGKMGIDRRVDRTCVAWHGIKTYLHDEKLQSLRRHS